MHPTSDPGGNVLLRGLNPLDERRLFCGPSKVKLTRCGQLPTPWRHVSRRMYVQWLLQEKTRRQELYQQFVEEASKLYLDALMHDQAAIPPLVSPYASLNKMRVVSARRRRTGRQTRMIVDTYFLPNKTFQELHTMVANGALDFLRDFSEACQEELDALTPGVLSYRSARGSQVGLTSTPSP
jgi:hypothetical protein